MTILVGTLLGVIFGASAGAVLISLWFSDHGSGDAPGGEPPPPLKPPPPRRRRRCRAGGRSATRLASTSITSNGS